MHQEIKEIKLYSTLSCPYCKMEKKWLDNHQVKHKSVMVDINPYEAKKLTEKTGQFGVPVTEIVYTSGKSEYVIGFDQKKLSELLNIN